MRSVTPPRSFVVSAARSSGVMTSKASETRSTPGSAQTCSRTWSSKVAERAAGDGQRDRDRDVAAGDVDVAHHVELGDRPLQLGVDDVAEAAISCSREGSTDSP